MGRSRVSRAWTKPESLVAVKVAILYERKRRRREGSRSTLRLNKIMTSRATTSSESTFFGEKIFLKI